MLNRTRTAVQRVKIVADLRYLKSRTTRPPIMLM